MRKLDKYMDSPEGKLIDVMGNKLTVLNMLHERHRDYGKLSGNDIAIIAECGMDILNAIGDYKDATR